MVVSLAIHAVLIVVALSFVAVTVIQKDDTEFVAKPVTRPRMPPKKIQAPVKMEKKKPLPKLRKQITVKTRMDRKMPEIRMPEIVGVKGGIGAAGNGGLGDGGGVGFTMPEIDIFGIKSKGEKVFIILDASPEMMYDTKGGIPAYTIIKQELVKIIGGLGSTTLFNIAVFDDGSTYLLFPAMVPANSANVGKVDQWLKPLNAVFTGMGAKDYGGKTLGPPGGSKNTEEFLSGKFQQQERWYRPAMLAMKEQADAIFLLTDFWGHHRIQEGKRDENWAQTSAGKKYQECYQKGLKMLAEENARRAAEGQPPKVLRDKAWEINKEYFPDIEFPPNPGWYYHTPREFLEAFLDIRNKYKPQDVQSKSGLKKKGSNTDFSFNVVHFAPTSFGDDEKDPEAWRYNKSIENFPVLTGLCNGDYRTVAGLEAIQSYVK